MPRIPVLLLLLAVVAGGCRREGDDASPDASPPAAAAPADATTPATGPVVLDDVVERDPRYIIGISYPPVAREHPGLAALLKAYADAARAELETALQGLGGENPRAPYDLSLGFTQVVATPTIVAVAADGSTYTGGAHGNPLVARFVWLPVRGERLTAEALVPDQDGWEVVSAYVREQLYARLDERDMIDQGAAPRASNFDQFEPVLAGDGRIQALRFVFPPYQVGPYSDGVQSVEVPAAILLPVVAAEYKGLFQGG